MKAMTSRSRKLYFPPLSSIVCCFFSNLLPSSSQREMKNRCSRVLGKLSVWTLFLIFTARGWAVRVFPAVCRIPYNRLASRALEIVIKKPYCLGLKQVYTQTIDWWSRGAQVYGGSSGTTRCRERTISRYVNDNVLVPREFGEKLPFFIMCTADGCTAAINGSLKLRSMGVETREKKIGPV